MVSFLIVVILKQDLKIRPLTSGSMINPDHTTLGVVMTEYQVSKVVFSNLHKCKVFLFILWMVISWIV